MQFKLVNGCKKKRAMHNKKLFLDQLVPLSFSQTSKT